MTIINSEYFISGQGKRVSKHAFVSFVIGVVGLVGYILLILASIISIGTLGVAVGFLGCMILLMSIFGLVWEILWYDEVRTLKNYKKSGIALNVINILIGIFMII